MFKRNKGFTLIELLVVVAVIGIFAAVTLMAIDRSRAKGVNTSVKANLRTVSQQVEMRFLNVFSGTYGTVDHTLGPCTPTPVGSVFDDATIQRVVTELQRQTGSTPVCASTSTKWAVSAQLKTAEEGNSYWCVETEGKAKGEAATITGTLCP
jgi:prepilin-type N-terminal cleavage/methylation domain-containing protein